VSAAPPTALSPEFREAVTEASRAIRARFQVELDKDSKVAHRAGRLFRLGLTVRRLGGRPRSDTITKAYELYQEQRKASGRVNWSQIARESISNWAALNPDERYSQRERLRKAVKLRIKRQGEKPIPTVEAATKAA
jgi:hypothetical protein